MMNREKWLLRSGVNALLRCDEAEVVQGIADYVRTQHRPLRIGSELMEKHRDTALPTIAAVMGAAFRFLEIKPDHDIKGIVYVARQQNEKRQLNRLRGAAPDLDWCPINFRFRPNWSDTCELLRSPSEEARRLMRLARKLLDRNIEYFRLLRVLEMLGYYARFLRIFENSRAKVAVTSNHSNPHGIAFNLAARAHRIPVVLITHGMPVRPVAPLKFDLAQIHCEAARAIYLEDGCELGEVFVHGRLEAFRPMATELPSYIRYGIFLCKDVGESVVKKLVAQLLTRSASHVLIRAHPKNLWHGLESWVLSVGDIRLSLSRSDNVAADLAECDLVLAGNSSVLIDAVVAGCPAAFVEGLDHGPADFHGFVKRGLIYGWVAEEDPKPVLAFYQQPKWNRILKEFANISQSAAHIDTRVAEKIRALALQL